MELKDDLKKRHSVRAFMNEAVPADTIKDILRNAQLAPSWVNSQPYKIYLAMGKTLTKIRHSYAQLSAEGQKGNSDVPVMSRRLWSKQAQSNMAKWSQEIPEEAAKAMGPNSAQLYYAPAVIYLTLPQGYSAWSLYDLGAFGENIVLGATDHGLASMTAYQLIKYPQVLRQELNIPDDERIIIGIALGHEDQKDVVNQITSTRMNLDDILKIKD